MVESGKKTVSTTESQVYCRIRPAVYDGSGHDQNGEAVAKSMDAWDDKSITLNTTYMFSKGSAKYTFPKKVFQPEATQKDVTGQFEPVIDQFISMPGRNAMVLAYGQTGTGKTHTIFGPQEDLFANNEEEYGVFPTVVKSVIEAMQSKGHKYKLYIQALQFYLMAGADLLDSNSPVDIDAKSGLRHSKHVELTCFEDLGPVLEMIFKNRKSQGTKMNVTNKNTSGSSRSHAALILTLHQVNPEGLYQKSQFHMVDLAGAERPDKVGCERINMDILIAKMMSGKECTLAEQGFAINWDLHTILSIVHDATEAFKKGHKYEVPKCCVAPSTAYVGTLIRGVAIMSMLICLSQAPQNGWETWFSLWYGSKMAELKVAIPKLANPKFTKAVTLAKKQVSDTAANADPKRPPTKYTLTYQEIHTAAKFELSVLEQLQ